MKLNIKRFLNSSKIGKQLMSVFLLILTCFHAGAQAPQSNFNQEQKVTSEIAQYRQVINSNTLTILGASLSGSYIKIVDDIAKAVNDGHSLRVIPLIGEGGSQNIRDILYLKGIDAGIVMSTSLEAYKKDPIFRNIERKLTYIARLYNEEFHIITNKKINSINDLQGKVVGFHGGAYVSGQLLFDKLKIQRSKSIKINFFKGLEKIKTGEISAIVRATARPMKGLNKSFDPNHHKLLPIKFSIPLAKSYAPAILTHKDYPNLISEGGQINTVSISVILAAFAHNPKSERYRRVAKFTRAFFKNFQKILNNKKRHRKWDEVNLAANLPGWRRFRAASEWINNKSRFTKFVKRNSESKSNFDEEQAEKLFKKYLEWTQKQKQ